MGETGFVNSSSIQKKLSERLSNPRVPASRLHGFADHYKIKLRATGYRLVYEVLDKEICVLVITNKRHSAATVAE